MRRHAEHHRRCSPSRLFFAWQARVDEVVEDGQPEGAAQTAWRRRGTGFVGGGRLHGVCEGGVWSIISASRVSTIGQSPVQRTLGYKKQEREARHND